MVIPYYYDFRTREPLQEKLTNLTGKQYLISTNDYAYFKYDKEYDQNGNVYTTTYQTYDPNTSNPFYKITASYSPITNKIKIRVKAVWGGVFVPKDIFYRMTVTPDFKNSTPFGIAGEARAMVGNNVPHSILVQFANEEYKYINILEIDPEGGGNKQWYIFDE